MQRLRDYKPTDAEQAVLNSCRTNSLIRGGAPRPPPPAARRALHTVAHRFTPAGSGRDGPGALRGVARGGPQRAGGPCADRGPQAAVQRPGASTPRRPPPASARRLLTAAVGSPPSTAAS